MIISRSSGYLGLRPIKVWINWLLDRIIGLCDLSLMDVYAIPSPPAQKIVHCLARITGDFCWLLRDFPRMSAYRIAESDLTVVFVGSRQGLLEIRKLIFPESEIASLELGRFKIWRLGRQTRRWLDSGTDLVVCELSNMCRGRMAPMDFSVPLWIQQVVEIPDRVETLLAGRRHKDMRERVNKARKAGFVYQFTTSREDFDFFHRDMYLPHVKDRHGDLALIAPLQDQWKRWFRRGGLVLAVRNGTPLAGLISYVAQSTCFLIETGVSPADPDARQNEINAFLCLSTITLAHGIGCRHCDMGGSHAYRSNGSFCFKRDWGARVARRRRIYPVWRFLARSIPEPLRNRLNELGFISEIERKFWGIYIRGENEDLSEQDINTKLREMKKAGLSGLVVVSSGKRALFRFSQMGKSMDEREIPR